MNLTQNKVNSSAMSHNWPELANDVLCRSGDELMLAVLGMFGHAGATKVEWNGKCI